jgi:hypothetical protein
MSQFIEDKNIEVNVTALYFIIYQQSGMPMGATLEGFLMWTKTKQGEFEKFCLEK